MQRFQFYMQIGSMKDQLQISISVGNKWVIVKVNLTYFQVELFCHIFLFSQMSPSQDQASSLRVLCSSIIKRAPFPIRSVTIATRPWPSVTCRPPSLLAVVRWEECYIAIIRWGFISLWKLWFWPSCLKPCEFYPVLWENPLGGIH